MLQYDEFDNDSIIIFKIAKSLNTVPNHIIFENYSLKQIFMEKKIDYSKIKTFESLLSSDVYANMNLDKIYQKYSKIPFSMSENDILMTYYNKTKNLKLINSFLKKNNKSIYSSELEFNTYYLTYQNTLSADKENVIKSLKFSNDLFREIKQNDDNIKSVFRINKLDISFSIFWKNLNKEDAIKYISKITTRPKIMSIEPGKILTESDMFDVFELAEPTEYIPFISYNTQIQTFVKIINSVNEKFLPENLKWETKDDFEEENFIYFKLWSGKGGSYEKSTKESFVNCFIFFSKSELILQSIDVSNISMNKILNIIDDTFHIFSMKNSVISTISGEFDILDIHLSTPYFYTTILTNPIINQFFHIIEKQKTQAEKETTNIKFKKLAIGIEEIMNQEFETILKFDFTNKVAIENETLFLPSNQNDLNILIGSSTKREQFIEDLSKSDIVSANKEITRKMKKGDKYLTINVRKCSDLINLRFFMLVISKIITIYKNKLDDYVKIVTSLIPKMVNYKEKIISDESKNLKRLEELRVDFSDIFEQNYTKVCEEKKIPLYVPEENLNLYPNNQSIEFPKGSNFYFICDNKDFPYPGLKSNKTLVNKDIFPVIPCCFKEDQFDEHARRKTTKEYYEISTDDKTYKSKYIKTYNKPLEPNKIGNISNELKFFFANEVGLNNLLRIGVNISKLSFLFCLVKIFIDNNPTKESVEKIKHDILTKTNLLLAKQELYDYKDIKSYLEEDIIFDSKLVYRLLEEYFDVNIYVFENNNFEIPRNKIFHTRIFRDRRCVLIQKNNDYSYEILFKEKLNIFDKDYNKILFNIFQIYYKVYTINYIEDLNYYNYFNNLNYEEIFSPLNFKIISQTIDLNGKVNSITFDNNITIFVQPTQPMNLPKTTNVILFEVEKILDIFKKPYQSIYDEQLLLGLWFPLGDKNFGFYVPVKEEYKFIKNVKFDSVPIPWRKEETDVLHIKRIKLLERTKIIILQIITWLFSLSKLSPDDFNKNHIRLVKEIYNSDSSKIYNVTNIKRIFPFTTEISAAFGYIRKNTTNLIGKEDIIQLYSEKMYSGILYFIKRYYTERKIEVNYNIRESFEYEYKGNNLFFKNTDELEHYVKNINFKQEFTNTINSKILEKLTYPMFIIFNDSYYIVQRLNSRNIDVAFSLTLVWNNTKINKGYLYNKIDDKINDYTRIIYHINPNNKLVKFFQDGTGENILEIIELKSGINASLLKLM